jgi:flagellar biosynthetic protein FlhB
MSVREMRDEFKQTEGDPLVKGKIRQLRQSRMRKRLIAAVPKPIAAERKLIARWKN